MTTRHDTMSDLATDAAIGAAKAAPPATVAALTYFGYSISDVVQFVMLIYALGLVAQQAWRFGKWIIRRGWLQA